MNPRAPILLRPARDNTSEFLARLEPFVTADGARNLNPISKELSLPYQTLRFRMLHLKDQGISVFPLIDLEKIGLERVRVFFRIKDEKLAANVRPFFAGLSESAGLSYYARTMLTGSFDSEFHIPAGGKKTLVELLRRLEELNMIETSEVHRLKWKDFLRVKTEFFDFSSGQWDVDFSSLTGDPSVGFPRISDPAHFDYNDLLIASEIQADPWVKVVEISQNDRLPERDVAYHLNKHVLERKLISGFRFRWVGTKEAWAKHTIFAMTFLFRDISEEDVRHLMSVFTSNPFTWNQTLSEDGIYIVETLIPISQLAETTQFISNRLRSVNLRPSETYFPDWSCVSSFTIPHTMFDEDRRIWNFSAERAIDYTLQSVKAYST